MYQEKSNGIYETFYNREINKDNFLGRFLPELEDVDGKILDLECRKGHNITYLNSMLKKAITFNYSKKTLEIVKGKVNIETIFTDMPKSLPFGDKSFSAVVADLSLHYFSLTDTIKIIKEIRRILKDGGKLFFRVNSANDINYELTQGELVEKNYYFVNGMNKRFFDLDDIDYFFIDFNMRYLSQEIMGRHEKEKMVWVGYYLK